MIYDLEVKKADGQKQKMSDFKGQVLLIVNVASKCGFTPQYKGLEELNKKYSSRGLKILAFPCNQFLSQEPGSDSEIQNFCSTNYDVTFPVMSKIEVNGKGTSPLFEYLKDEAPGVLGSKGVKWNFTKFLVDRSGRVVKRFAPNTPPERLAGEIEALL